MWMDIAAIVFVCTTVNHLSLIADVEKLIKHRIPIINCPKCFTCWSVFAYCLACHVTATSTGLSGDGLLAALPSVLPRLLAISLSCSYLAIWLELIEGLIDRLYDQIYGKIYPTADTAADDAAGA